MPFVTQRRLDEAPDAISRRTVVGGLAAALVAPVSVVPALARAQTPPPERLGDAALADAIDGWLADAGQDFSGAVLVARRDRVILTAVRGLADRERDRPNRLATRFRVGSMDKMFTGLAIMQLVQAGRLDLHAPLATWLPDYPNAAVARTVTPHHLLTHTGGAGDIFGPEFDARRDSLRTLADYVALFGARPAEFTPGTRWEYSNYGYILLGRIIEAVSRRDYYDHVRDHVFVPAGMTGAGFGPESTVVPDRPMAYAKTEAGAVVPAEGLPWRGTPAGGGYATVEDFHRFVMALYDGRLLDAGHRRTMTEGRVEGVSGMLFGYGFAVYPGAVPPMIGHNGIADGMSGDLRILGDGQVTIAVLANVAPPFLAGKLGKFISARVTI
jgi:CubicO group peptidase (beta-lactamase class C family)